MGEVRRAGRAALLHELQNLREDLGQMEWGERICTQDVARRMDARASALERILAATDTESRPLLPEPGDPT